MSKNLAIALLVLIIVFGAVAVVVTKKKSSTMSDKNVEEIQRETSGAADNQNVKPTDSSSMPNSPIETVAEVKEISLSISAPASGTVTGTQKTTVKGKTSPKAEVFANEAEGIADMNGNFSLTVQLDEGENSIIVTAVDADGKVAEKEILVTYEVTE